MLTEVLTEILVLFRESREAIPEKLRAKTIELRGRLCRRR